MTDYDDPTPPRPMPPDTPGTDSGADRPADPDDPGTPEGDSRRYRGGDPVFGFLLAIAISTGLTPVLPAQADLRYTLAWGALALVSVLAWLLGNADRIGQEDPVDLAWGVGFGLILSAPFALFFFDIFQAAARLMFPDPGRTNGLDTPGTVLAFLVFVQPLAETLFFRGLMQRQLVFWLVGALATVWSVVLVFPVMWGELLESPAVGGFLVIAFLTMNMLYSYVRDRNGLAAAWLCQITTGLILFFMPFL
jgi:hypothetical protein